MTLPKARFSQLNLRGKLIKLSAAMQFLVLITLLGTVGVGIAYATSLTLSDGEWVGLGASAGRLQVEDAATDQILIEDAEFVHNESGGDFDFRVEGDTEADLFIADAGSDVVLIRKDGAGHQTPLRLENLTAGANNTGVVVNFQMNDDGEGSTHFAQIRGLVTSATATSERGSLRFDVMANGSSTEGARLVGQSSGDVRLGVGTTAPGATLDVDGSAIFNESGADVDLRVEGDTINDVLLVDASIDTAEVNGFFSIGADGYFDECCTTITISSNAVTVVDSFHALCAGTGDDDELHTINGNAATGTILVLMSAPACDYTVKDGSGNISLAGDVDFLVEGSGDMLMLIKLSTTWIELGRSDN